jgi:flagellar FliJ protein
MSPSKRLRPVQRVSESSEQDAARVMGQAQAALHEQEKKLAELETYLRDYQTQLAREGRHAVSADRLQEYRGFMSRLGEAIARQRRKVDDARSVYEKHRRHWLAARQRCQSLEKAVERYRRDEDREAGRREQRETDDRACGKPSGPVRGNE